MSGALGRACSSCIPFEDIPLLLASKTIREQSVLVVNTEHDGSKIRLIWISRVLGIQFLNIDR